MNRKKDRAAAAERAADGPAAEKETRRNGQREELNAALPTAFQERMQGLLGGEYEAFRQSYEKARSQGLRFNPLKMVRPGKGQAFPDSLLPEAEAVFARAEEAFGLREIPWARGGYYYDAAARPGRHPYHEAGLYYIQEPSAMAAAELLDPQPGERILDLCAAPGGKTTQIAGRLRGRGLLVSNEIHPERVRILAQNVERFGAGNVVVTNEEPSRLAAFFPEFFDRVLVDAPCSGEGMFRKDETAVREWSPDHVRLCAARQAEILDSAAAMLKDGGRLVYSTCTFSPEENEGSIQRFLDTHTEFAVVRPEAYGGFSRGRPEWVHGCEALRDTLRIWPHLTEGEGHYVAVLRKETPDEAAAPDGIARPAGGIRSGEVAARPAERPGALRETAGVNAGRQKKRPRTGAEKSGRAAVDREVFEIWRQFCRENCTEPLFGPDEEALRERMFLYGEQLYLLPEGVGGLAGIRTVRPGLHLGTVKKNRLEPAHALALYLRPNQALRRYELQPDGPEIAAYLGGEAISAGPAGAAGNGWVLMTVDGYPVGWAKRVGSTLKNHYPKGLRRYYGPV